MKEEKKEHEWGDVFEAKAKEQNLLSFTGTSKCC